MNRAVIVYYRELAEQYRGILEIIKEILCEKGLETVELGIDEKYPFSHYMDQLKKYEDQFICSIDMAGFQFQTLLGDAFYNILRGMQVHLVLNEEILDSFNGFEFALNVFLFVPDGAKRWIEKNGQILNLSDYSKLQQTEGKWIKNEHNKNIIRDVICSVMQEFG